MKYPNRFKISDGKKEVCEISLYEEDNGSLLVKANGVEILRFAEGTIYRVQQAPGMHSQHGLETVSNKPDLVVVR